MGAISGGLEKIWNKKQFLLHSPLQLKLWLVPYRGVRKVYYILIINHLVRSVITGKPQTEVLMYWPRNQSRAVHKLTHNYHGYLKWKRQDRWNQNCKKKNATSLTTDWKALALGFFTSLSNIISSDLKTCSYILNVSGRNRGKKHSVSAKPHTD